MTIFRNIENWTGDNTGLVETVQHKDSNGTIISSYDELTDKPLINGVILQGDVSLDDLNIQPKGDYVSSEDIPSKISELENDKGYLTNVPEEYITKDELDKRGYLTEHQDLSGYAKNTDVPTKVSQLTNDKNYITSIPEEYITENELNAKGFITEKYVNDAIAAIPATDLSKYATLDDVDDAITEIVGAAPETLDTLAELAEGLVANRNVVEVLNDAIEQKANSKDLASLEDSVDALQIQIDNINPELPIATTDTLGGIKVGDNLTIDENGKLSSINDTVLPVYDNTSDEYMYLSDIPDGVMLIHGKWKNNPLTGFDISYYDSDLTLIIKYNNSGFMLRKESDGRLVTNKITQVSSNYTSAGTSHTYWLYTPVNNLTTNSTGKPLDAKQGKVLNDKITELQGEINSIKSTLEEINNTLAILTTPEEGVGE